MDIQTVAEFDELMKEFISHSYSECEIDLDAYNIGCTHQEAAELAVISFMVNQ